MSCNYDSIRADNKQRYGTDIGRFGPMLLADRYDNRTHFIYELLQNAEDALTRRNSWSGSRSVTFDLSNTKLRISHFGMPFTDADVKGICGIAESTKGLTSIGRFGIGFKSVYAFTDCPEIHSDAEHFAIDSFVWPRAIPATDAKPGETTFILPLRPTDSEAHSEIVAGLRRLDLRTLLFLQEIEEISWSVEGGASGLYLRNKSEPFGENARKVVVIGEETGVSDLTEETWLVFSREVCTVDAVKVGNVEVAFALGKREEKDSPSVCSIDDSTLVVFFPTIVPTNLGFLLQGPYRTTPSRDNVPHNDLWNQHLLKETATLLTDALRTLRDKNMLDTNTLRCLPLERSKFGEGSIFAPLFESVRTALIEEPLLPSFGNGHVPARAARLARTQELRELFDPFQLASILQEEEVVWLSEEITQDRTPDLRRYLMQELGIPEITPETILPKLTKTFLESQNDEWIVKLYEFLNGQPALLRQRRLDGVPFVRLKNGTHATAKADGQLQAFLPSSITTDFPTVRHSVCATEKAREFLESLGLSEPDPVDDVVRNVLPKYAEDEIVVDDNEYETDIGRIVSAFETDSQVQREKLVKALRNKYFARVVDAGTGTKQWAKPDTVYLATERLKDLFEGVVGVLLVDNSLDCLRGEKVRDVLEAAGAARYLRPLPVDSDWKERLRLRELAGTTHTKSSEEIKNYEIHGLKLLLEILLNLEMPQRRRKAAGLWEALSDLEQRQSSVFTGTYTGQYYGVKRMEFEPNFVELLRTTSWIPDVNGLLQRPEFVVFDTLGWKANPFLLSKILFKPPIIEALAKEAGIEPGVLDLLRKLDIISTEALKARLGIKDHAPSSEPKSDDADLTLEEALSKLGIPPPTPSMGGNEPDAKSKTRGSSSISGVHIRGDVGGSDGSNKVSTGGAGIGDPQSRGHKGHSRKSETTQSFISYVGVHPGEDELDPDGLAQQERMALEELAIDLILKNEHGLTRMPANNPGFDLVESDSRGNSVRWIEVKAMTGDLHSRPVGLSRTQFESAQEHGDRYWLYVVERASSADEAHIVRIQNPAGKARTFTFDHGWLCIAEVVNSTETDQKEQLGRM
jgi:hypothetical protein